MNYENNYIKPIIKVGTISIILTILASFIPCIYLLFLKGIVPDKTNFLVGLGNTVLAYCAFYFIEPMSYYSIYGAPGVILGVQTGNQANLRLPAALTAQQIIGCESGTKKGEIVAVLGIVGSILTNFVFLLTAVLAGQTIIDHLPASVIAALNAYILPSLFGGCLASVSIKRPKILLIALPIAIILRLMNMPTWVIIFGSVAGTVAASIYLYKKGDLK